MDKRQDFHTTADSRYAEIIASGMSIPWAEMRSYLQRRLIEPSCPRPAPRAFPGACSTDRAKGDPIPTDETVNVDR